MGTGATLAIAAVVAWPGAAIAASSASASTAPVTLSSTPLGVDVAPWDPVYSNPTTYNVVQPLLEKAGIRHLHYGGGVTADSYDWQTDTDISNCPSTAPSEFTATCATNDALSFSLLSAHARALGAQTFATVNYGTGTTAMAGAWAKQAATTAGQAVAQWEIGNESYGCWENNNNLAGPPANYAGYKANDNTTCPMVVEGLSAGMQTMADSYAANAAGYMSAIKAQDPSAQIGVPWAFDWTVGGATVGDNGIWNNTVLGADAQYISFVDAHWYPFGFGGNTGAGANPTDQQVIQSVEQIPSEYTKIRTELDTYDPSAKVIVGETGVSYLATNVPCTPAGALFAAGDVLSWLAAGAQSVDWWPLDTDANLGGTCVHPDEAMFTSTGVPTTPYMGYLLASALAKPGAHLSSLTVSNPADVPGGPANVLGFQSVLPDGKPAVALINTNTSAAQKVTVSTALTGNLSTVTYSAGNQNAANMLTVTGTTTSAAIAGGITLPAESIVVLTEAAPSSAISLHTVHSNNTFGAGTWVTLQGKLTVDGAAAPAGTAVKIYRHMTGPKPYRATLTVHTGTNGTFTARNLPPAYGKYIYLAQFAQSGYKSASSSVVVHVTAAKPHLKLGASARRVKRGGTVRVTATLLAPHVNRWLTIYAYPKGGSMKVIKHARINSKDQVTVLYRVMKNTVFIVKFSGDNWYKRGSATTTVAG